MAYTTEYFEELRDQVRNSAEAVAPLVVELLEPRSVVDVGCGTGAWAAAFRSFGVEDVVGIDGAYCDRAGLEIPASSFVSADLTLPLALARSFDLAVCLEVAEHLDEQYSDQLVASLAQLAPAVLFSAAIPDQGGLHHVNEQWPQFWARRFALHDFMPADILRKRFWSNNHVAWWYAQNMVLYVQRSAAERFPRVAPFLASGDAAVPGLVHPKCLQHAAWRNRVLYAAVELMRVTPPGSSILIVDEDRFGELPDSGRELRTFPARKGAYQGPPANSMSALFQLQQERRDRANFIAFGWPAFWWLDHYAEFAEHLRVAHREIWRSNHWIIFALNVDYDAVG